MNRNLEGENKVISLFNYIKELNNLRNKSVLNVSEYSWTLMLSNIHEDPDNIKIYYRDRVLVEDENDSNEVLLAVRKPILRKCPVPDPIFVDYLVPGWEDWRKEASIRDLEAQDGTELLFLDDPARVDSYNRWLKLRDKWCGDRKIKENTRNLFSSLYALYYELIRESETKEIIVANGMLCDNENKFKHPILTHRVEMDFDSDANIVYIKDTNAQSELYTVLFSQSEISNSESFNRINEDFLKNDYHPLDRNDTPSFLKTLVHQLSSNSFFSDSGIPDNWQKDYKLLLYTEPCFIMRKRLNGTAKAIEQIIENIEETGEIPVPIWQIVNGGVNEISEDEKTESIEEQLAAVGGESKDVFLSKEANREQLEIAKRIECNNAVLVQGPPGTGKTHTIANLMGHFFAEGKSVLVTSYTSKALSVLKDKVAPNLQNLCVSVLDESNSDMEKAIDGITSYMSDTTSVQLKKEMDAAAIQRNDIIEKLADVRRKIFKIINQENTCIVFNGEEISPSQAAKFLADNLVALSDVIPGKIYSSNLPLSFDELVDLYRSNEYLSENDEQELNNELPDPQIFPDPSSFSDVVEKMQAASEQCSRNRIFNGWSILNQPERNSFRLSNIEIAYPQVADVDALRKFTYSFDELSEWKKYAAIAGKNWDSHRKNWQNLISAIKEVCQLADKINAEQFNIDIDFLTDATEERIDNVRKLKEYFSQNDKIGFFDKLLKKFSLALEFATINGHELKSPKDCRYILDRIELQNLRRKCAAYWDELLAKHDDDICTFNKLDEEAPESIAKNFIPAIESSLDWYYNHFNELSKRLNAVGLTSDFVCSLQEIDSDIVKINKIFNATKNVIPQLCDIFYDILNLKEFRTNLDNIHKIFKNSKLGKSETIGNLKRAALNNDSKAYSQSFNELKRLYEKSDLLKKRVDMLNKLKDVAPEWASAIANREGIHGLSHVPADIENAWKWKHLSNEIRQITSQSFGDLQNKALFLSQQYKKVTAEYAEKSAWYHLLQRTEKDIDMQKALQGWKQTVKRIGKGTGKRAPQYKAEARNLMTKCQKAVPGWIMPINKALETLNPKKNRFDVVIIDEASQADISALAILYLGKKLIVVGDDKQVTPLAIGVEINNTEILKKTYIKDLTNFHLYDEKASIYDIAATTFRPLMLREHFRCVPEIIGFSNMLSYDGKIKPLRETSSSKLQPAVVNYRVKDGERDEKGKFNIKEAETIVALMQSCIEQPEYAGKTFGVISLLGDEQVKKIQNLIEKHITAKDIQARKILCGNSANFQGDERDVVFLSLVDSGKENGPIRKLGEGEDDSAKKRYNVAASRAKDQLWVVDSLDSSNDLKPGDLRKKLIEWSLNPQNNQYEYERIDKEAESPFESEVAKALFSRGFHIVQQFKVGAYRLDMVAICNGKKVAIECDGERYHSGEAKIREDMERQTILERAGWKFIRIRGSEYYSSPEKTINWVVSELNKRDIKPENAEQLDALDRNTELLQRVKNRALEILEENQRQSESTVDLGTIEFALNAENSIKKSDVEHKETSVYKESDPLKNFSKQHQEQSFLKPDIVQSNIFDTEVSHTNSDNTVTYEEPGEEWLQNPKNIFEENLKMAELGDAEAQYNVGSCYQYGYGVEQNQKRALKWYKKAARRGLFEAIEILKEFEKR